MKRIILLFIPLIGLCQSSMGLFGNAVITKAGTKLHLESRKTTNGYDLSITHRYYSLLDGENAFSTVVIHTKEIGVLKQEIKEIFNKYIDWVILAKNNNIQDVEKVIPVAINSISDMYCNKYSYPTKKEISTIFKVSNYNPQCIIKIIIGISSGENRTNKWIFQEGELLGLIDEIDGTIQHQKSFDERKKKTEELFH